MKVAPQRGGGTARSSQADPGEDADVEGAVERAVHGGEAGVVLHRHPVREDLRLEQPEVAQLPGQDPLVRDVADRARLEAHPGPASPDPVGYSELDKSQIAN